VLLLEHTSRSPDDTAAFARRLARCLKPGDVLLLQGDLGAGKTTLTRALAEGLGIDPANVSSPTFVIAQRHENEEGPDLVHVDAYRLDEDADLDALGWDRLADGSAVLVIEWPERIAALLPSDPPPARLTIEHLGETERRLTLELPETWQDRLGVQDLLRGPEQLPERHDTTCPVTGQPVPADSPTWPFANEQARMADLYRWFSGQYSITRRIEERDLEEG